MDVRIAKRLFSEETWNRLETEHVARFLPSSFGHIPNLTGPEKQEKKFVSQKNGKS